MSKPKSVVLLSAGLDSTVNLYMALQDTHVIQTLTFDYGQRAAPKEIERAKLISDKVNVPHKVVSLPVFKDFGQSSLIDRNQNVPTGRQVSIDDKKVSLDTAKSVWVPNRNGIFLNIAAGYAESLKTQVVIPGFNKEEAASFPDNSYDFIRTLRKSFQYSTSNHVDVLCFTINLDKNEIVEKGITLKVPFEMTWSCYLDGDKWCGQCESCKRSKRAYVNNKLDMLGYFKS